MSDSQPPPVRLDERGLVAAVCQDAATGQVLMAAHMNREALRRTLETGEMHFYSRSRAEQWRKGDTSGAVLHVESASIDCDGDVLLFRVHADGPACHTGETSCFFTALTALPEFTDAAPGPGVLDEVFQIIRQRQRERPEGSYTARLFDQGTTRIAQKIAEEGAEVALAAATGDREALAGEAADLLYHLLVLLADADLRPDEVWAELRRRRAG